MSAASRRRAPRRCPTAPLRRSPKPRVRRSPKPRARRSPKPRARRSGRAVLVPLLAALLAAEGAAAATSVDDVRAEDREALESLAGFPAEVREAALEAARHPQAIARIHEVQRRSSADFRALIDDLPRDEQEKVWSLIRYPELVAEMVDGGPHGEGRLRAIADHYPESVRDVAVELGRSRHELLVKIHALDARSQRTFEQGLEGHAETTRAALRTLVATPDALDLLTDHMHMTVILGGAYAADPEAATADLARLHEEVLAREVEADRAWREEIAADPEARRELEAAEREYAEEYDVALDAGERAGDGERADDDDRPRTRVNVFLGLGTYPYWFGYPAWYVSVYDGYPAYYYWRPLHLHPVHWGVSFGSRGFAFHVGYPGFHFAHWYFSRPIHHHHYPRLSHRIIRHHEHHPRLHRGGHRVTRRWLRTHHHHGGRGWLRDDGRRHRRLREYGRLEHDYRKLRSRKGPRRVSRYDVVRRSPERYPNLRERMRRTPYRDDDYGRVRQRERSLREGDGARRRSDRVDRRERRPDARDERARWRERREGDPRTRDSVIRRERRRDVEARRAPGGERSRRDGEARPARRPGDRDGARRGGRGGDRGDARRRMERRSGGRDADGTRGEQRQRASLFRPERPTRGGFESRREAPRQRTERRRTGEATRRDPERASRRGGARAERSRRGADPQSRVDRSAPGRRSGRPERSAERRSQGSERAPALERRAKRRERSVAKRRERSVEERRERSVEERRSRRSTRGGEARQRERRGEPRKEARASRGERRERAASRSSRGARERGSARSGGAGRSRPDRSASRGGGRSRADRSGSRGGGRRRGGERRGGR